MFTSVARLIHGELTGLTYTVGFLKHMIDGFSNAFVLLDLLNAARDKLSHSPVIRQPEINAKWVVEEVDEESRVVLQDVEDVHSVGCERKSD